MKRLLFLITINFIFFNFAAHKDELTEKNDKAYQKYLERCAKISENVLEHLQVPDLANIIHEYHCIPHKQWKENNRLFFDYAKNKNWIAVESFLDSEEFDVNARGDLGRTVLILAAYDGQEDIVKRLIKVGADVNAKNVDGLTVLMGTAFNGHKKIVEMLINAGADVNAKNKNGFTALMMAAMSGRKEILKMLIDKGANVNAENNNGQTALKFAVDNGYPEIADMLKKAGAKS